MEKLFQPTLLDQQLKRKRRIKNKRLYFEPLPKPLQPTPYVPPKPTPPPRRKRPIPFPRAEKARVPDPRVQKLTGEIAPFYRPEAIQEFRRAYDKKKVQVIEKKEALKNTVKSFKINTMFYRKDPRKLLAITQNDIFLKLAELLEKKGPFKFSVTLKVEFKKSFIKGGQEFFEFAQSYFNSLTLTIMNEFEIKAALERAAGDILNRIATWFSGGSGWVIENIISHFLNIVSYIPLRGSSYLPLPEELRNSRKGLLSIKNDDSKCLLWCHIRYLNPLKRNPQRITLKDQELVKTLDYSGVTFPVSIKDMKKIEVQNKININVLGYSEDHYPYPIRISSEKYEDHLELLLIEEEKEKERENIKHLVLIQNFDQFMFNFSKHKSKKYFCMHSL